MTDNGVTDIVKMEVISNTDFPDYGSFVKVVDRAYRDWDDEIKIETADYHAHIFLLDGRRYQIFIKDQSGADLLHAMLEDMRKQGIEQGRAQEKQLRLHRELMEESGLFEKL